MNIENKSQNRTRVLLTILAGWLFSLLLLTPIRGHLIGPFILVPGFIAAIVLLFHSLGMDLVAPLPRTLGWRYFLSGIVIQSVPYWVSRPGKR